MFMSPQLSLASRFSVLAMAALCLSTTLGLESHAAMAVCTALLGG
jgi:hypothetical protein